MKQSTRQTQWLGVALAAVVLAFTMWPRHAPVPAIAPTSAASGAGTDRSFDDLSSEHAVEAASRGASAADGAAGPLEPAR